MLITAQALACVSEFFRNHRPGTTNYLTDNPHMHSKPEKPYRKDRIRAVEGILLQ